MRFPRLVGPAVMSLTSLFVSAEMTKSAAQESSPMVSKIQEKTAQKAQEILVTHTILKDGTRETTTENFCMRSPWSEADATTVARRSERVRTETRKKWFGLSDEKWTERCDVHIHPNAEQYAAQTGVPKNIPGHTVIEMEKNTGRIVARVVHLQRDALETLLAKAHPHEVTHAVIAGHFGTKHVPRWFDEGVAVWSENKQSRSNHLAQLPGHRYDGLLFTVRDLLKLEEFPERRRLGAFYGQSTSLMEYLMTFKNGPQGVTAFVQECARTGGHEAAAKKHFSMGLDELDRGWHAHAFPPVREP